MLNLYTLLPLLFLLISSFYFNKKKLDESLPYILMVSFFEGIISYFFVYLIFLEGFFDKFYQYLIMFLLIAVISYIFFLIEKDLDNDMDLQIETIKNNLILYAITIAPFYIFLTVFRFEGPFIQVLYSVLSTSSIIFIYMFFREPLNYFTESIYLYFAEATANIFLLLWGVVVFLVITFALIDIPVNIVRQQLNLSDNVPYFSFNDFPTNLDNNFSQEKAFQFELPENLGTNLVDYYLDGDLLYVYSNQDVLYTIDVTKEEIIYSTKLGIVSEDGGVTFNQITNIFFESNDQLYILSRSGLHKINPTNYEMISTDKTTNTKIFYHNEEPFLLKTQGSGLYHIYQVEDDEIVLYEEIERDSENNFTSFTVISSTLFKIDGDIYIDYFDDEYSFQFVNSSPLYDKENHLMYYSYYENQTSTVYIQAISQTIVNEKTLRKLHNTYGIIVDEHVFYVEPPEQSIGRIEITNPTFQIDSIINHRKNTRFWVANQYHNSYIINYLAIDNELTYLQVEQNNHKTLLTLEVIKELETGLSLPFYSFYGLFNFIPVLVFLFIPMSNYRTEITFIGFDQLLKKKKE
ncbi:MAG: hypothetical protein ACVCEJ_06300 [Candidatus Izemoplasmataceae bacterium]